MKKAVFVLASAVLATPMVFAQAKNFQGFSLGGNITSTKTTFDTAALGVDGSTSGLDLQLQYNFALAPQFVLGVGGSLGLTTNKAGTYGTSELSTKNRVSLEVTPAYVVSDAFLVYGKLASLGATIVSDASGSTTSDTIGGIGYGFGVRGLVDKNMFWQLGYDIGTYAEKNDAGGTPYKVKSSTLSLGVGYKF